MALVRLSTAVDAWWLEWRPGPAGGGTPYTCLVSELAVGDFLCGSRVTVTALGTAGTTRTVTGTRVGDPITLTLVSASTVQIIRP